MEDEQMFVDMNEEQCEPLTKREHFANNDSVNIFSTLYQGVVKLFKNHASGVDKSHCGIGIPPHLIKYHSALINSCDKTTGTFKCTIQALFDEANRLWCFTEYSTCVQYSILDLLVAHLARKISTEHVTIELCHDKNPVDPLADPVDPFEDDDYVLLIIVDKIAVKIFEDEMYYNLKQLLEAFILIN